VRELNVGLIEEITARVLEDVGRAAIPDPRALSFLLRRLDATRRDDLRGAIGSGLDRALADLARLEGSADRADWLTACAEAAAASESPPLREAAAVLLARLRRDWHDAAEVRDGMRSIGACLSAVHLCEPRALVPEAIDELERMVGAAYRPGDGMARRLDASLPARGGLEDQVAAASTLLTAHALTGRLPYSMLADELMQVARRAWWDEETGAFSGGFVPNCDAVVVLCRLAALHADADYRRAAVTAVGADYARDAGRTLLAQQGGLDTRDPLETARFGLALDAFLK
jgi:hypothetical protein